ncbi:MAG: hypothetical protein V4710_22815 [Verrucomicrobiota bacterium]
MTATVLAIPIALGWLYFCGVAFGIAGGETWKIGYYGKFNRMRSVIEQMPDIRIVDSWQHRDVTLEDFGFTVISRTGQRAEINFPEGSPEMKMSNREEIQAYVRTSLAHKH